MTTSMSDVMAAGHLRDEIGKKLSQAKGICIVICEMHDMAKTPVAASLWAAEELIEDAKKAVDPLYEQASRSAEEVQS